MNQQECDKYNVRYHCNCGSGKDKWPEYDGHGIFLTHVCDDCFSNKMSMFRDDIKDSYYTEERIEPCD